MSCMDLDREPNGWMKLSRLGFLTGFSIAILVYWGISLVFPPRGLGEGEDHHDEDTLILPSAYDQSKPTMGQYSHVLEGETISHETVAVDVGKKME